MWRHQKQHDISLSCDVNWICVLRTSQNWKLLFPKSTLKFSLTTISVKNTPQCSSQRALKQRLSYTLTKSLAGKVCSKTYTILWATAICTLLVRTLKVTFSEELSQNMRSGMRVSEECSSLRYLICWSTLEKADTNIPLWQLLFHSFCDWNVVLYPILCLSGIIVR